MKYLSAAVIAMSMAASALAADVGISISVGEPGFYGRIDIGNVPRPQVIYTQPVIIQPGPVIVDRQPIYLRVPPTHAKEWRRHCHRYYACNQPVYFVQDNWYRDVYAPRYREEHPNRGHGRKHREQRDEREHEGRNRDRHHDNGRGHGHGRDKRDN